MARRRIAPEQAAAAWDEIRPYLDELKNDPDPEIRRGVARLARGVVGLMGKVRGGSNTEQQQALYTTKRQILEEAGLIRPKAEYTTSEETHRGLGRAIGAGVAQMSGLGAALNRAAAGDAADYYGTYEPEGLGEALGYAAGGLLYSVPEFMATSGALGALRAPQYIKTAGVVGKALGGALGIGRKAGLVGQTVSKGEQAQIAARLTAEYGAKAAATMIPGAIEARKAYAASRLFSKPTHLGATLGVHTALSSPLTAALNERPLPTPGEWAKDVGHSATLGLLAGGAGRLVGRAVDPLRIRPAAAAPLDYELRPGPAGWAAAAAPPAAELVTFGADPVRVLTGGGIPSKEEAIVGTVPLAGLMLGMGALGALSRGRASVPARPIGPQEARVPAFDVTQRIAPIKGGIGPEAGVPSSSAVRFEGDRGENLARLRTEERAASEEFLGQQHTVADLEALIKGYEERIPKIDARFGRDIAEAERKQQIADVSILKTARKTQIDRLNADLARLKAQYADEVKEGGLIAHATARYVKPPVTPPGGLPVAGTTVRGDTPEALAWRASRRGADETAAYLRSIPDDRLARLRNTAAYKVANKETSPGGRSLAEDEVTQAIQQVAILDREIARREQESSVRFDRETPRAGVELPAQRTGNPMDAAILRRGLRRAPGVVGRFAQGPDDIAPGWESWRSPEIPVSVAGRLPVDVPVSRGPVISPLVDQPGFVDQLTGRLLPVRPVASPLSVRRDVLPAGSTGDALFGLTRADQPAVPGVVQAPMPARADIAPAVVMPDVPAAPSVEVTRVVPKAKPQRGDTVGLYDTDGKFVERVLVQDPKLTTKGRPYVTKEDELWYVYKGKLLKGKYGEGERLRLLSDTPPSDEPPSGGGGGSRRSRPRMPAPPASPPAPAEMGGVDPRAGEVYRMAQEGVPFDRIMAALGIETPKEVDRLLQEVVTARGERIASGGGGEPPMPPEPPSRPVPGGDWISGMSDAYNRAVDVAAERRRQDRMLGPGAARAGDPQMGGEGPREQNWPEIIRDEALILSRRMLDGVVKMTEYSRELITKYGDAVKEHVRTIFADAKNLVDVVHDKEHWYSWQDRIDSRPEAWYYMSPEAHLADSAERAQQHLDNAQRKYNRSKSDRMKQQYMREIQKYQNRLRAYDEIRQELADAAKARAEKAPSGETTSDDVAARDRADVTEAARHQEILREQADVTLSPDEARVYLQQSGLTDEEAGHIISRYANKRIGKEALDRDLAGRGWGDVPKLRELQKAMDHTRKAADAAKEKFAEAYDRDPDSGVTRGLRRAMELREQDAAEAEAAYQQMVENRRASGGVIQPTAQPNDLPANLREAREELAGIGMTIGRTGAGEYRVNVKGGKEDAAYYTDDLADAVRTARDMRDRSGFMSREQAYNKLAAHFARVYADANRNRIESLSTDKALKESWELATRIRQEVDEIFTSEPAYGNRELDDKYTVDRVNRLVRIVKGADAGKFLLPDKRYGVDMPDMSSTEHAQYSKDAFSGVESLARDVPPGDRNLKLPPSSAKEVFENFDGWLTKHAQDAKSRLLDPNQMNANPVYDYALVIADMLRRGVKSTTEVVKQLGQTFGRAVKPYLEKAYATAKDIVAAGKSELKYGWLDTQVKLENMTGITDRRKSGDVRRGPGPDAISGADARDAEGTGMVTLSDGTRKWYVEGQLHRLDGPAIEYADGTREWYVEGRRHRLDGPAIEYADGTREWYVEGRRHRLDGPAIEYADGTREWYVEGRLHRLDGPAIEYADGTRGWYVEGKRHRLDGPAIELADGTREWYVEGWLHRLDGPAIEHADGTREWYVEGKLHRLDGPAIEYADGTRKWYVEDRRHRLDGPAIEYADGTRKWYVEDRRHRLDGPAIESADGTREWYVEGRRHRLDGPAIEDADGTRVWFVEGRLHRLDGPAIERANGDREWYVAGEHHRLDGPAIEYADGTRKWYIEGVPYGVHEPKAVNMRGVSYSVRYKEILGGGASLERARSVEQLARRAGGMPPLDLEYVNTTDISRLAQLPVEVLRFLQNRLPVVPGVSVTEGNGRQYAMGIQWERVDRMVKDAGDIPLKRLHAAQISATQWHLWDEYSPAGKAAVRGLAHGASLGIAPDMVHRLARFGGEIDLYDPESSLTQVLGRISWPDVKMVLNEYARRQSSSMNEAQIQSVLRIVNVFGKRTGEWIKRNASEVTVRDQIHDVAYWLPWGKPAEVAGLADVLLRRGLKYHELGEKKQDQLRLVAEAWSRLPDELKRGGDLSAMHAYALKHAYRNVTEQNAPIAKETRSHGAKQELFDEIAPRWVASLAVPDAFPVDKEWNSGNWAGRFLPRSDPRGLWAGKHSESCQYPDGLGNDPAWHSQESPNGGVFVFENRGKEPPGSIWGQSWVWRAPEGRVFDNIELRHKRTRPITAGDAQDIRDILKQVGKDLGGKTTLGTQYTNQLLKEGFSATNEAATNTSSMHPVDYSSYRDSVNQVIVYYSDDPVYASPKREKAYIRTANESDSDAVTRVVNSVYPRDMRYLSYEDGNLAFVLVDGDRVAGYAIVDTLAREFTDFAIMPESRKYVAKLLKPIIEQMRIYGGIWTADLRKTTSLPLVRGLARRGVLDIVEEGEGPVLGGEQLISVKIQARDAAQAVAPIMPAAEVEQTVAAAAGRLRQMRPRLAEVLLGEGGSADFEAFVNTVNDLATITSRRIAKAGLTFRDWAAEMKAAFGNKIIGRLRNIWRTATQKAKELFGTATQELGKARAEAKQINAQGEDPNLMYLGAGLGGFQGGFRKQPQTPAQPPQPVEPAVPESKPRVSRGFGRAPGAAPETPSGAMAPAPVSRGFTRAARIGEISETVPVDVAAGDLTDTRRTTAANFRKSSQEAVKALSQAFASDAMDIEAKRTQAGDYRAAQWRDKPHFRTEWTEKFREWFQVEKRLAPGRELVTHESGAKTARISKASSDKAKGMLEHGISGFEDATRRLSESFDHVLAPFGGDKDAVREFENYLIGETILDRKRLGMKTPYDDKLPAVRKFVESRRENKQIQMAYARFRKFEDAILAYAQEAGLYSPKEIDAMKAAHPNHAPLYYLIMPDLMSRPSPERYASVKRPFQPAEGAKDGLIMPPLESVVKNLITTVVRADQNAAFAKTVRLWDVADVPTRERIMREVTHDYKPAEIDLEMAAKDMAFQSADHASTVLGDGNVAIGRERLSALATVFSAQAGTRDGRDIVSVYMEGKLRKFQILDKKFFETVMDLRRSEVSRAVPQLLTMFTSMLRTGAVTHPGFAITNWFADTFWAGIVSPRFIPLVGSVRGLFDVIGVSPDYINWKLAGGGMATISTANRGVLANQVARHMGKSALSPDVLREMPLSEATTEVARALLKPFSELSRISEESTRLGVFRTEKAHLLSEAAQKKRTDAGFAPLTEAQAILEAVFRSRDIADFLQGGRKGRLVNSVVPFFNIATVTLDKAWSSLKDPMTQQRLYMLFAGTALLWAYNSQDPRWAKIPDNEKRMFWIIMPWWDKDMPPIKIRKPHLFGEAGGSALEVILDEAKKHNPQTPGKLLDAALRIVPPMVPQAVLTPVELIANYSLFRGAAIESPHLQRLKPEDRYTDETSEFAKNVGRAAKVMSPAKIDYLISQTGGGLATQWIVPTIEKGTGMRALFGDDKRAKPIKARSNVLGVPTGRFFSRATESPSQILNDFYAEADKVSQIAESFKNKRKQILESTGEARRKLQEEYRDEGPEGRTAVNLDRQYERFKRRIADMRRSQRIIDRDTRLSPEERRKRINEIYAQIDEYVLRFNRRWIERKAE